MIGKGAGSVRGDAKVRWRCLVAWAISRALAPSVAEARPVVDAREMAREVIADERYQTEVSHETSSLEPRAHLPESTRPSGPRLTRDPPKPPEASDVSRVLLWMLSSAAVLGILAMCAAELGLGTRLRALRTRPDPPKEPGRAMTASLEHARHLAASGEYQAAVHALLEAALGRLRDLPGFELEPSFTAREVLDKAPIEPSLKAAFSDLVDTVERSLFGGLAVHADDFGRCEISFLHIQAGMPNGR